MNKNTQIKGKGEGQIVNQKIDERVLSSKQKTSIMLEKGKNATTFQGGFEIPIMFKEVLAGEYIESWNVDNIIRILTPLVPSLDKVYATISAYFVPHTRVWDGAEKALANKEQYGVQETDLELPYIEAQQETLSGPAYKWTVLSKYGLGNKSGTDKYNLLLPRGYRAIENDFLRVKEYEPARTEWKNGGRATSAEISALTPFGPTDTLRSTTEGSGIHSDTYILAKAKARKSYLTNIKKNMITSDEEAMEAGTDINIHLDWQNRFNDAKQRIDNAEKNDWDIIAEMGGTKAVIADRVQKLGEIDYELNYQQITQTSPVIDNSAPLGTTGSFSYTRATGSLFNHKEFNQHGFIHILINLNMDTDYEGSIPKELLKLNVNDIYRPGLATKETQLLLRPEIVGKTNNGSVQGLAYQPAWAEYKRLPTFASGEMQTARLNNGNAEDPITPITNSQWHNMYGGLGYSVISADYFKPANLINTMLARNNVLTTTLAGEDPENRIGVHFDDDPIVNISQHTVKTKLPIVSNVINSTDKAETER